MLKTIKKHSDYKIVKTIATPIPDYVAIPYEVFSNKLKLDLEEYGFLIWIYGISQPDLDIRDLYQALEGRYTIVKINAMVKNLTERGYLNYDWSLDEVLWNGKP